MPDLMNPLGDLSGEVFGGVPGVEDDGRSTASERGPHKDGVREPAVAGGVEPATAEEVLRLRLPDGRAEANEGGPEGGVGNHGFNLRIVEAPQGGVDLG
ncbi:MAG: hypothetical protein WD830_10165 [Chloroflexota bacterium]